MSLFHNHRRRDAPKANSPSRRAASYAQRASVGAFMRRCMAVLALLLGMAGAIAAGGYTIQRSQETLVRPGMTTQEVLQALGPPARNMQFGARKGPTWTYNVSGPAEPTVYFDVDFGADDKVMSVSERVLYMR